MAVQSHRARSIAIGDLRPAPWNTNVAPKRTLDRIRRSLRTFGIVENLVVRQIAGEPGFEVVSGNHRLELDPRAVDVARRRYAEFVRDRSDEP